ncbi:sugar ABC transporter permease [Nocardioides bruguierae]|uniref:Xylose transport system permease protein XylH n=1 Tax=Nocardioides bruguierae TaxID=2945102 RepID=A0A9X2IFM4_9ACTN|nr:sugar ABC transporter permease [Nocardioides bruguierae]MCL8025164.1 sugar ABC transporter permease [Nocardioides bruguierae]MCM0621218.1 sugar ABC transporter permease [Nocardioides bruguierae]
MSQAPTEPTASSVAADASDERLIQSQGIGGVLSGFVNRVRGGELGMLPVIVGLIVIAIVFQLNEPTFLSSRNLVSITQFAAPVGVISLGIVLVLLLGEIDLSVGSVSGFAAASMAVLMDSRGWDLLPALLVGILVGTAIGCLYALLYTWIGVPSFVFSLAGLLAFQGALLFVLGDKGTVVLPQDSALRSFAREKFLSDGQAYVLLVVIVVAYVVSNLLTIRRRRAAGLTPPSLPLVLVKAGLLLVGLGYLTYYLGIDRGWSYLPVLFALLVFLVDLALRRTTWGRHVFAVGGNEEAARRSGIRVPAIYVSVFALCSTFAALGGILIAGQLTSVSQSSGTTDTNLTAIAAAVIGGTSLFGGRGSAWSAMLGIVVLQSIQSGLNLMNVDSSVRFIVTGAVLLLAVAIDSVSRKARTSSGRG